MQLVFQGVLVEQQRARGELAEGKHAVLVDLRSQAVEEAVEAPL